MGALIEFFLLAPGLTLLLTAAGVLVSEATHHGERKRLGSAIALFGFGAAFMQTLVAFRWKGTSVLFDALVFDGSALLFQALFLLGAMGALLVLRNSTDVPEGDRAECLALIAIGTLFASWGTAAADLLPMFLCLQFWLLCASVLAGFRKESKRGKRAAWSGYLFSTASTVLFGLALSIVFSRYGTLRLSEMESLGFLLADDATFPRAVVLLFGLSLLVPLAAFPMMGWFGGVFASAPAPAAIWLSWAGQALAIGIWNRLGEGFFAPILGEDLGSYRGALVLISGATLLFSSAWALTRKGLREICGALAVSQGAFLLFSVIFPSPSSLSQSFYFLLTQWVGWVGLFLSAGWIQRRVGSDALPDLRRIGVGHWAAAASLLFFVGTIAGIPPFPGLPSRFFFLATALEERSFTLAWTALAAMVFCGVAFAKIGFALCGALFQPSGREGPVNEGAPFSRGWVIFLMTAAAALFACAHPVLEWVRRTLH